MFRPRGASRTGAARTRRTRARLDSAKLLRLDCANYAACSLGTLAEHRFGPRGSRPHAGSVLMYVCLCVGATSQTVSDAVAGGASTSKEVAAACGAGTDCGRCRRTLRAIIAAAARLETSGSR